MQVGNGGRENLGTVSCQGPIGAPDNVLINKSLHVPGYISVKAFVIMLMMWMTFPDVKIC